MKVKGAHANHTLSSLVSKAAGISASLSWASWRQGNAPKSSSPIGKASPQSSHTQAEALSLEKAPDSSVQHDLAGSKCPPLFR